MNTPVSYIPAVYVHNGARPYVHFSVRHPETNKMVRYRHYFARVKDPKHRRQQATAFVTEVNDKLLRGWAPWQEEAAPLLGAKLKDVLELFIKMKSQTLRGNTMPTYRARVKKLLAFMAFRRLPDATCHQLTPRLANEFMDALITEGLAVGTYNNYLMDMKGIGNWAVARGYWAKHPFDDIRPMKKGRPDTRSLTEDEMAVMLKQIEQHQPELLIICGLIFYCVLRPQEISMLQVHQIDTVAGLIRVKADDTKDDQSAWITIPQQFIPDLERHIAGAHSSNYLISHKFRPGPKRRAPNRFSEAWQKHRDAVGLPHDVNLYGLKHTALRNFSGREVDPVTIRDHARHSNLAVTDAYMKSMKGFVDSDVRDKYPDMR